MEKMDPFWSLSSGARVLTLKVALTVAWQQAVGGSQTLHGGQQSPGLVRGGGVQPGSSPDPCLVGALLLDASVGVARYHVGQHFYQWSYLRAEHALVSKSLHSFSCGNVPAEQAKTAEFLAQ